MTTAGAVPRGEVPEAFDEVANRYDLMVALNPGYHAHLRRSADVFARSLGAALASRATRADQPLQVIDLGCGSGASTRAVVEALDAAHLTARVTGIDGSEGMLREARRKAWPVGTRFVHARAEELADRADVVGDGRVDGVFAAYLVRNVPDRDALLGSLHALLAPGGVLVFHEYSVKGHALATGIWTAVCWLVVVPLGWLTSRRTRLYRYLWRSVMDMDSTSALAQRLQRAGFEDVRTRTVRGWQHDIIHTVHARRPR
jgi:ubiquinone/menaquinone biosynthesis C-methylase UbiE